MRLEFHQLERRGEHLRARRPERQRRLLASLAASGQQTPIVVVAVAGQPDRYLVIDKAAPEIADYVATLKQRSRKLVVLALRQLLRLVREYPREPLLAAVREAARYGLYDLDRLERMILRRVACDYFLLDDGQGDEP